RPSPSMTRPRPSSRQRPPTPKPPTQKPSSSGFPLSPFSTEGSQKNMANISIADIKALREQLGTGMVDTKKALEEADGDLEKATEILRLKGAKGNAKRADR